MDGSDVMVLFMIVSISNLAQIYMEPKETASSNLHVSGLTYSPQCAPVVYSQTLFFRRFHLILAPILGMEWSDAMALSIVVGIPDLAQIYMEPMETASSNLHVSGLTYSPQGAPFVYSQTR